MLELQGRWEVLEQRAEALRMWGYTDGTVFYLARSEPEKTSSGRMALGPFVWRMADGSDALYQDCVGPSSYAKAQGRPVRVWGMLANGTFSTSGPLGAGRAIRRFPKCLPGANKPRCK